MLLTRYNTEVTLNVTFVTDRDTLLLELIKTFKLKLNFSSAVMNELSIKQYWFEFETWRRILGNIQSENVYLKNRLAQIIKEETANELLDDIEHYHNILLTEDNNIALLRNDVASQENWLRKEVFEENATIKEIMKSHNKLRKEIQLFEQNFNKLKFEYNIFFAEKRIK